MVVVGLATRCDSRCSTFPIVGVVKLSTHTPYFLPDSRLSTALQNLPYRRVNGGVDALLKNTFPPHYTHP